MQKVDTVLNKMSNGLNSPHFNFFLLSEERFPSWERHEDYMLTMSPLAGYLVKVVAQQVQVAQRGKQEAPLLKVSSVVDDFFLIEDIL